LNWKAPNVGTVVQYFVYRLQGATVTPISAGAKVQVGGSPVPGSTTTLIDTQELPDGVQFTYFVVARFDDGTLSGASNFATITAANDAPVANNDSYNTGQGTPFAVAARVVLINDTDVDSDVTSLTAVLETGPSHAAAFTLNANGSFAYTPSAGFVGTDTFTYRAKDVSPISARNAPATVSITVGSMSSAGYRITITLLKSPAQLGSAVPVSWQLGDPLGNIVSSLSTLLKIESVFNGSVPPGGCAASANGPRETLYGLPDGATGNSSFRLVSHGYQFNWDTTTAKTAPVVTGKGCYTILLYLNDQLAARMTTAIQLK
jgi:hypothetical protein